MTNSSEEDSVSAGSPYMRGASRRRLLFYLLPIAIVPLLIILAAFFVVPTSWFTLHSGNTYMANIGYADTLSNSDCQVLVYGDSTALTSVDPFIIEAATGLKTCNLAEFEGMTSVNETLLIDRYLNRNPRPRFIVFMYTPDDLRIPEHWNKVSSFEAVTYRIRQGLDSKTLKLLVQHPADTLGWAEQGMRMTMFRFHTSPMGADKMNIRQPYNGQLRLEGTPSTACEKDHRREAPDPAWLSALRTRYSVEGTQVVIDATPVPGCDLDLAFFQDVLPGAIDDDPLPIYPVGVYLRNTRLHMNEVGSRMVSQMIARQIAERMHTPVSSAGTLHLPAVPRGL